MPTLALIVAIATACGSSDPQVAERPTTQATTTTTAATTAPAPELTPQAPHAQQDPATPGISDTTGAALSQLATLAIKGRAPKTGYSRDQFGPAWTDAVSVAGGRNGCDTRNDMLQRDLTNLTFKPGSRDCAVLTGVLQDPYTGTTIEFQRGTSTSMEVQIDHIVALSDAWQKGAQQLDFATRQDFANDPRNLQATQGRANQQKGDGDAATWLPPNKPYRCTYVARQVEVKAAYGLWVTAAEHDAIERELLRCGEGGPATPEEINEQPPPEEALPPAQAPAPAPPQGTADGEVYYANCAAARAAGAAPIYRGEPGYRSKLDGDNDGIACE